MRVELESSLPDGGSKNVLNMVIQNSIPISNLKKKTKPIGIEKNFLNMIKCWLVNVLINGIPIKIRTMI